MSQVLFTALVLAVGLERVAELVVSRRNAAWSFARGGVETGQGHFPAASAAEIAPQVLVRPAQPA